MNFMIGKMGMRVIPTLVSFILLIIFITPFFAGIINLGNCAGVALSAIICGFFAFYAPVMNYLKNLFEKPAGKIFICLVSVIMAACVVFAVILSVFMINAMNNKPNGKPTTLVILGCKVKGTNPSLMLKRRLDASCAYLNDYNDVTVIVSGGKGDDEQISEAQCMKDYLVSQGIASERIIMEDESSSTYENLKFSQEKIKENQLNEKVTIVTDGYHQFRAKIIADSLDIETYSISAKTTLWLIPTYWVREWFGIVQQIVFR